MNRDAIQARFPTFKVINNPDPACVCSRRGTPGISEKHNVPCLCVCLGGDDRAEFAKEVGRAAVKVLSGMMKPELL